MKKMTFRFDLTEDTYEIIGCEKSLGDLLESFLYSLRVRGLSKQTLRSYGYDILHLFRWLEQSGRNFQALNQETLLEWVALQREQSSKPKSINRRLSVCYIFYRFCFNSDIKRATMFSALISGIKYDELGLPIPHRSRSSQLKVKVPRTLIKALEPKDVSRFMESMSRYRDLAVLLLMLLCGLRSGEILGLKLDDINFIGRSLRVRGKGDKERMLPLHETVSSSIQRYLRYERPQCLKEPLVFVILQGSHRGRPMTASGLRSIFRARRRSTGLTPANPHRFRHCFGTEMARAGVQLPVLRDLMGHSSIKQTLQYIQLSMADIAAEYERALAQIKSRYENP